MNPNPLTDTPNTGGRSNLRSSTLRSRLAIVGLSGLMFTGVAVGLTGMASAQSSDPSPIPEAPVEDPVEDPAEFEIDEGAVFERFEACLTENGLDEEKLSSEDAEPTDAEWDAIDQAFESCEPILEDLGAEFGDGEFHHEDFDSEDFELSPEDEALFEKFDECLTDSGVNEEEFDAELTDEDFEALNETLEQAFESCESILDDLSEDAEWFAFEGCPDDFEDHEDGEYQDGDHVEETLNA